MISSIKPPRPPNTPGSQDDQSSFSQLNARELYCPKCNRAMPVRAKMLLVLAQGELYDYLCAGCGSSLGTRQSNG